MKKKFHCMIGNEPCIYISKNPMLLGWTEYRFETLEKAADYIHNFLGEFSPGKEYFLQAGATYHLYDDMYRIVEVPLS